VAILAATAGIGLYPATPARADAWGCSYEKCLAYCTKVGGQKCNAYCSSKLKEKQQSKVCPAT
jgi:hypothetical protein